MNRIDSISTLELKIRDRNLADLDESQASVEMNVSREIEGYSTYREPRDAESLKDAACLLDPYSNRPSSAGPIQLSIQPSRLVKSTPSIAEKQRILRNWEGVVIAVNNDFFKAELHDLTGKVPNEIVEIGFDEIDLEERELVETGTVFYFTIFQRIKPSGTLQTTSEIRFKRLAKLDESDRSSISAEALKWIEFFVDE